MTFVGVKVRVESLAESSVSDARALPFELMTCNSGLGQRNRGLGDPRGEKTLRELVLQQGSGLERFAHLLLSCLFVSLVSQWWEALQSVRVQQGSFWEGISAASCGSGWMLATPEPSPCSRLRLAWGLPRPAILGEDALGCLAFCCCCCCCSLASRESLAAAVANCAKLTCKSGSVSTMPELLAAGGISICSRTSGSGATSFSAKLICSSAPRLTSSSSGTLSKPMLPNWISSAEEVACSSCNNTAFGLAVARD
eukprot:CAMPEP_0178370898 /NCGR_PEP_ID=MMETSP0689_2-20121128/544_1 /TAXON_ID=160604 /ORGANISM="Amphidinium massartii, Strain CS-259" /LENGTH=253 /DNA_ID=CAMNT_0019990743 /DNA_START=388 /DNA_END=1150 /DNA_ORIENTATION=-